MTGADLSLAAAIADPARRGRPGAGWPALPAPADPEAVIAILRRNKVPLAPIAAAVDHPLAATAAWRDAVAEETAAKAALLSEYREVASALQVAGIDPVLFKSPGGLPYRSSNLDALVHPDLMDRAARLLEATGHLRLSHYREPRKLLFRRFRGGRPAISVHLHAAVSWGRLLILPGAGVVARSRQSPDGECRVASLEDLLVATLAHSLFETDQIRLADLAVVRLCATSPGFDWEAAYHRVRERGWTAGWGAIVAIATALERSIYGDTLVPSGALAIAGEAAASRPWSRIYPSMVERRLAAAPPADMPLPLSRLHSKIHFLARICGEADRSPDERMVDVVATAANLAANRLRLRCRPATLISLSGLDGSGKSHVAGAVADALTLCEVPTRKIWNRGGFSGWMEALKRTARTTLPGSLPPADDLKGKQRWLAGRAAGTVFGALVAVEQGIRALVLVRVPLWLGRTIVCDRFTWDAAADLEAKLGPEHPAARIAGDLIIAVAPRPRVAILLRVDPAVAARRKPGEAHLHRLDEQARAFDRLCADHGLIVIDADRPEPVVTGEVVDLVLGRVLARFAPGEEGET